jgi:hypothetical protein
MKPRPDFKDESLTVEVARTLLPQVVEWAASRGDNHDEDEHTLGNLVACMDVETDSYDLAKILEEDFSWRPDSQLVRILDRIPYVRHAIYNRQVEEWVEENKVHPSLDVGAEVTVSVSDGERHGRIQAVIHKEARYQVDCGKHLLGVPYEQVHG